MEKQIMTGNLCNLYISVTAKCLDTFREMFA